MQSLFQPNNQKIELDAKSFKALASSVRMSILKAFTERKWNVTELAARLEMSKSTIHSHLQKLEEAGLIKKTGSKNKWVYYSLSEKGKAIFKGTKTSIVLIINSVFALLSGFFLLYLSFSLFSKNFFQQPVIAKKAMEASIVSPETVKTQTVSITPFLLSEPFLAALMVLGFLTIFFSVYFLTKKIRE